ncbi:MAG: T9SS type A sorting domain-containing protein [Saprospiraceae bacterium]|nr:T9SS type A sorting domain-containing protein [Saprospiraceae bacterium]
MNISYTAYLEYPMRGPNDPNPLLCTVFNWTLPQGWSLASPPGTATTANITVTTSATSGGTLSVTGIGTSGCLSSWSNPKKLNITRVLPSPCPITTNKEYLVCGSTSLVNFLANETPVSYLDGVTNVVYNWTFPPEWTPNGATIYSALSLIPDGMTSATINVTATAFGVTSKPCAPIYIPYEPINRETAIIATNSTVCNTGTFSLNIPPPANSTVTWEILPIAPSTVVAVTPSSGTGTVASVSAISNLSGRCKIKFTITNDCGTATRELEFFAGEPILLDPRVNGMAPEYPSQFPVWYVCPGTHTLTLKAFGGSNGNNCVTWALPASPPIYIYEACNYLDVSIPVFNQQMGCISFTATLENECGPNFITMRLCPRPSWMCQTEFGGNEPGVSLFPNPATDQITIQTIGEDLDRPKIESIQIINTLGNVVKTYTVAPDVEHTLPLFGIPDGTYYVRIQTDYGLVTKSLIVGAVNNGSSRL